MTDEVIFCSKSDRVENFYKTKTLERIFPPKKHYLPCARFRVPSVLSASEFIQSNISHNEISVSNWEKQCSRDNPVTLHHTHTMETGDKNMKRETCVLSALWFHGKQGILMKDSRDPMPAGKTYTIRASGFLIPCKIMSYFHQEQIRLVCKKESARESQIGNIMFLWLFRQGLFSPVCHWKIVH